MSSEKVDEKHGTESNASHSQTEGSEIDIYSFHEKRAGRLIIDPAEAKIELGEAVAAKLKLSADGTKVLWPQPTDSDLDPQNWSDRRKTLLLIIITLAAIVPDFDSGIGIAAIFALAVQYNTTTGVINNLTSKTAPQVTGLYIVTDLYPFHLQARKLNIWTMGFLVSPFLSPFAFGFLVARTTWRWAYGIGSIYSAIVVVLIALFMEETMYDRTLKPIPLPTSTGLRLRIENLVGITGMRMQKYRISWFESVVSPLRLVTNAVFLGSPPPFGYGFSEFAVAGGYGTPIVSVILGELVGRYTNDWIMNASIRRNKGVFEAESRLWACYIAIPLYICGFVTLGASFQKHLSVGALVMGWGIAEFSVMINTVAIYAYCNDAFPKHQGEISALINLARTLGGFSVAYFQVPWALKHGAIQTFGCEAAIVTGLFLLFIPILQYKGSSLRAKYSLH
ncbi:Efflux pump radE [Psilocybe cubensis]|uniref:Efflux pump radE n=1 Tax=Psilocybe cubensis TaxID=181762 RepID=A0ACB8GQJ9_PSICU|nr:Efflux pump radE [Psilocybe cubensis]KAH9477936.1 Efflux pump radE [Psilocybe cubensis]